MKKNIVKNKLENKLEKTPIAQPFEKFNKPKPNLAVQTTHKYLDKFYSEEFLKKYFTL